MVRPRSNWEASAPRRGGGLVRPDGENLLRWVPAKDYQHQNQPYQGPVHQLDLLWMP